MTKFDGLIEANNKLATANEAVDQARAERDHMIYEHNQAGVSKYRLAHVVGISQHAVTKIVKKFE